MFGFGKSGNKPQLLKIPSGSSYQLKANQSGSVITGLTNAAITVILPEGTSCKAGETTFTFIQRDGSDTITPSFTELSTGTYSFAVGGGLITGDTNNPATSGLQGANLTLLYIGSDKWIGVSAGGTWTVP